MFTDRGSKTAQSACPAVGETIAGWRLVRPLTADGREFIAVAEFASTVVEIGSEHWSGFTDRALPKLQHRRLVVASGADAGMRLSTECALRDEVGSEFVELAEEILTDGDSRIAIFPIQRVRSWRDVVAAGTELDPGAVVTALVPIVETVGLAHRNGIAHGAIGVGACRFDEEGRPSLDAWGSAIRLEGLTALKADLARSNDLRALGRLGDTVLGLSTQDADGQLRRLIDALRDGVTPTDAVDRLTDALFQWSEPGPLPEAVLPRHSTEPGGASHEGGKVTGGAILGASVNGGPKQRESGKDPVETLLPIPDDRPAKGALARVRAAAAPATAWASRVRPRIWAAFGLVGALTVFGGVLVVTGNSADSEGESEGASEGADADTASEIDSAPDAPVGFEAGAVPAGDHPPEKDGADVTTSASSAQSLDALPDLLAAREECLAAAAPDCLAPLYSPNAPGLQTDRELLSDGNAAWAPLSGEQDWVLAADLGDIELFSGSVSGSVSLERTPDGWRLREIWLPE
ncbi:hypothetical protein [Gulosibacter molinativorax]|nr:hypothetical protein [Gulosibacter molinativorax]QUY61578.1 Hypotetical protein [Gulosibacter molinativorax]